MTMPPPEPLSGAACAQFRAQTRTALARIREVENIIYAGGDEPSSSVANGAEPPTRTSSAPARALLT